MRGYVQKGRYQCVAVIDIGVVGQYARRGSDAQRSVFTETVGVVLRIRCVVAATHRDSHRGGIGSAISVTDRIGEGVVGLLSQVQGLQSGCIARIVG